MVVLMVVVVVVVVGKVGMETNDVMRGVQVVCLCVRPAARNQRANTVLLLLLHTRILINTRDMRRSLWWICRIARMPRRVFTLILSLSIPTPTPPLPLPTLSCRLLTRRRLGLFVRCLLKFPRLIVQVLILMINNWLPHLYHHSHPYLHLPHPLKNTPPTSRTTPTSPPQPYPPPLPTQQHQHQHLQPPHPYQPGQQTWHLTNPHTHSQRTTFLLCRLSRLIRRCFGISARRGCRRRWLVGWV